MNMSFIKGRHYWRKRAENTTPKVFEHKGVFIVPHLLWHGTSETSPLPVKGCKFWPMLGTEQWGFFSMTHYLWRWASVYNGYPRGPVTFAPNPERLEVELSLHVPVLTTLICHGWDSNTLSYACGRIWRWHHYRWRGSNVDLPPRWLLGRGFVSRAGGRVSSPGRSNR